jgi:two-component sensor histidine kinase
MNAMKYAFPADADGRIVVRLRRADEGALLTVEDNGVGKAEPIGAGSVGLGSQIVFLLCRQFGGEPSYESGSGAGDRRGLLVIVPLPSLNTESQQ